MESKKNLKNQLSSSEIIGENIRLYRKRCGFSLKKLSQKIGISPQQLQKYETGTNRISAEKLFDLSIVLKTSLQNFYYSKPKKTDSNFNEVERLLENFNRITSKEVRKLLLENTSLFADFGA